MGYIVLVILFSLLGGWVNQQLKNKFAFYNKIRLHQPLTGAQVAEKMLLAHQITEVKVTSISGHLTDHYDPQKKTVNLSPDVYHGSSTAAVAVAAHECGHAIQHAEKYPFLGFRSALVPLQLAAGQIIRAVSIMSFIGGIALQANYHWILLIIVVCYACFALFSLVTLPVEIDASRRALIWLKKTGIVSNDQEYAMSKDALKWAAMTYIVAAISALAMLGYYLILFLKATQNKRQQ